ncbi:3-hydroxybutyryl-CoA dehydrogenase [Paeniclostridium ghonii]|uniref:3-hydroxybutyryl-CoA dehydrogenase n=2 Tax=Paraclostridium ghonii TaxID=29358 RepID=A0ABU0N0Y1_9FIRM|nr:3-hydroxybutyryl-CoA dehydrogenase [Paeniclostridium ghonii]
MGRGVVHSLLLSNVKVKLIDVSNEILEDAIQEIKRSLRFQCLFNKNIKVNNIDDLINKVKISTSVDFLNDADIIIENGPEILAVKEDIYKELNKGIKDDAIILVNTSCISITKIASLMKNKERVIGVHFMNPVYAKNTLEVIKGEHTSNETIEETVSFLKSLGKESIIVNDYPGFVSNRISHLFMNEAAFVVQDSVASPSQVDAIFKECFEHKMGPLETADLIGLDTVVNSLDILYESYNDPKFRVCPLLRKMVHSGYLGRKSGKGFYEYK